MGTMMEPEGCLITNNDRRRGQIDPLICWKRPQARSLKREDSSVDNVDGIMVVV